MINKGFMLGWILAFSLMGSVGALAVASAFFYVSPKGREKAVPLLLAYATGTLLGAAFLGLLPHALEKQSVESIFETLLAGIVVFFIFEKALLWHHCQHDVECVDHLDHHHAHTAAAPLILIGDSAHKFIDGIVVAVSFMVSIPVGVATSLAIVAHEIPHNVGDFAILMKSGYTPRRALKASLAFGTSAVLGAVLAYFAASRIEPIVPYLMAFSAAGFIYIAVSDLVPGLHKELSPRHSVLQVALIVLGIVTVALLQRGHSH